MKFDLESFLCCNDGEAGTLKKTRWRIFNFLTKNVSALSSSPTVSGEALNGAEIGPQVVVMNMTRTKRRRRDIEEMAKLK